jgi:hypothetical protein
MLSLEMSNTAYKKLGMRILLIIVGVCSLHYLVLYFTEYMAIHAPSLGTEPYQSRNIFAMVSGLLLLLFLLVGCISLIIVLMTVIKLLQIQMAKGKSHFNIDAKSVKVLTPLSFFEQEYSFNKRDCKIISINIDNSDKLSFCVTLEVQKEVLTIIFWKTEITKHGFHLYDSDYTKLVNFIKKTHPDLRLTFITEKEDARGWKGTGR